MAAPIISSGNEAASINSGQTSTSADTTNHPDTNVLDQTHPLRTFRTTLETTSAKVSVNIASTTTIIGVFVDNVNVDKIQIHTMNGNSVNHTISSSFDTPADPRTGRRKAYVDFREHGHPNGIVFDGTPNNLRISRASGAVTYGSFSGTEWGAVVPIAQANQLDWPGGGINALNYNVRSPLSITTFSGGQQEFVESGELFVEIDVPNLDYLVDTQQTDMLNIVTSRTAPFVFYENSGDTSMAYTVRYAPGKGTALNYKLVGKVLAMGAKFVETI